MSTQVQSQPQYDGPVPPPSFETLYADLRPKVERYIGRRAGFQSAEDLTSEVFLRVWRSWSHYEERGLPVQAWVFAIAHNLIVDYLRAMERHSAHLVSLFDSVASGHDQMGQVDRIVDARAALLSLPERRRRLLLLYAEGYSSKEIALATGLSANVIKQAIFKGRHNRSMMQAS